MDPATATVVVGVAGLAGTTAVGLLSPRFAAAAALDKLKRESTNARVDELRRVFEQAALSILRATNVLRVALAGGTVELDARKIVDELQASEASIAVRLGNDATITATYRAAVEKWVEAVTHAYGDHNTRPADERNSDIADAFNEALRLSKVFNDEAAAVVGPDLTSES